MRALHKSGLIYFAVIVSAACAFCMIAAIAAAAPATGTVSLSSLAAPSLGAPAPADDSMPVPSTPFTPNYFGANSTNDQFPSNGNDYQKGGGSVANPVAGLEGRGPHGGYDTTTYKCGVCHAAHSAGSSATDAGTLSSPDAQFLVRKGTTGCEYCHTGNTGLLSSAQVYTANKGNVAKLGKGNSGHAITGKSVTVPASDIGMMTLECTSCHSVHGTLNDWMPTDYYSDGSHASMDTAKYGYKLLLSNPGGGDHAAPNKSAREVSDFGADTAAVNQFTLSVWCASCHDKAPLPQDYMTATGAPADTTTFTTTQASADIHSDQAIATDGSSDINGPHYTSFVGIGMGATQCYTCHRGGLSAEVAPLNNAGVNQLSAMGYTAAGEASCSLCHYGTADFANDPANLDGTSDWPHSSVGDEALLGNWTVDQTDPQDPILKPNVTITADIVRPAICSRCHPVESKNGTDLTFFSSGHMLTHSYPINPLTGSWATSQTVGTLQNNYSPGYGSSGGN